MASNPHLPNFILAMQHVYAFPTDPSSKPWIPPPAAAGHRGRYLWTDAFGVLNFLTLYRLTSSPLFLTHAISLVSAVHSTLGRTRDLSSPLPGATPSNHLGGGLRIGKDFAMGPDGDGQYHHYLTLWMFALNRLSVASREKSYNTQAIALAKAIHPHFVYNRSSARPRMYWKMSMDLRQPLVRSEGNLDPVDGLVIFRLLREADGPDSAVLAEEISDYEKIVRTKWEGYNSSDPLDLGMTLWTAHWYVDSDEWARGLQERARRDLTQLWEEGYFERSTKVRLAFREFGTALGMRCGMNKEDDWEHRAEQLTKTWEEARLVPIPEKSNTAGMNAEDDLLPITETMYAACLIPGAFQKGFL
ncbi:hypothetical protein AOQ84DRAFT_365258 [Glonium stellatum]|uniref:Uncharacterized protein n=1 Tax=Glonium stellatum TaxID=574774 RepID=A0A8E2EYP2_9PEZI|nr:hypothetical protein AOQ84DRAFT_365258 [Glonium stellatum]